MSLRKRSELGLASTGLMEVTGFSSRELCRGSMPQRREAFGEYFPPGPRCAAGASSLQELFHMCSGENDAASQPVQEKIRVSEDFVYPKA